MNLRLLIFLPLLSFSSCKNENPRADIPFRFVREEINLGSIQNQALWNVGGHIYIENAGYKGIIVIHKSTDIYVAFERACTYDPKESCALVEMDDSQLFLIDHCCKSTFNFDGIPTGGAASIPLVEYRTFRDGNSNFLVISNE